MQEEINLQCKRKLLWGVFSRDCYGLDSDQSTKFLLGSFEEYNDALVYAESVGENTAIHFTRTHKKPEVFAK